MLNLSNTGSFLLMIGISVGPILVPFAVFMIAGLLSEDKEKKKDDKLT